MRSRRKHTSVTSRSIPQAGSPARSPMPRDFARNIALSQLAGDILTATLIGGRPLQRQARQSDAACLSTPGAGRPIQAAGFEQRQEDGWRDQSILRVLPAQQGLDTGNSAGVQSDLGLVVQQELPFLERRAQPVFHATRRASSNSSRCGDADSVRPTVFASLRAASAFCTSSCASCPSSG